MLTQGRPSSEHSVLCDDGGEVVARCYPATTLENSGEFTKEMTSTSEKQQM
jgi:hypothetical protein